MFFSVFVRLEDLNVCHVGKTVVSIEWLRIVIPDTFPRKDPNVGRDGSVSDGYFDIFVMNCLTCFLLCYPLVYRFLRT